MRLLAFLLFLFSSTPALSQPVLTITDARNPNPIAPYVYFMEDFTHKLTYEQVSRFPLDSFQRMRHKKIVQLGYRHSTIWMRFSVQNQTSAELFLISTFRFYDQLEVFLQNETGGYIHIQSGAKTPPDRQLIVANPPIIPLGLNPRFVYVQLLSRNSHGDYLRIGNLSQAISYQKQTGSWQSLALGVFLIVFLYALVFFLRLRDPLLGWYALLMFSFILFYLDFYRFLSAFEYYSILRPIVPIYLIYQLCWSLFHIKFLNLRHYSKTLYWAIISLNAALWLDFLLTTGILMLTGSRPLLLYRVFYWLGIEAGGQILIWLFLLLAAMIYVSLKNFRAVFLYAVAFSISLVGMIISMFATYDIEWLPFIPFNNSFVPATLIEVVLLGYILGERANEHRRQQARTQQQLIGQLQENLHQKTKLLQIRDEIARDLHDEVGATLTAIAISTKLVQKKAGPTRTEITPILEQIQTDSQVTIHSLRDTVWALNPDNDAPEKLLERMRAAGFQIMANQDITLAFESELTASELPPFSMEQRRNIYFVFKEALHNIVKHAHATNVAVHIFHQSGELHIRISDNGIGFEPTRTGEGNGLNNFQKRAVEGGFSVTICSEPGQGTTVELRIPVPHTTKTGSNGPVTIRTLIGLLLFGLSTPALSQPILTITDARKTNPIAPYTYFLRNVTPQLTYGQVTRFPLDSFQSINRKEVVHLTRQNGMSWLRFSLKNQTNADLFLISSFRAYNQVDVFVLDDKGGQTHIRSGAGYADSEQLVSVNPPVIPLGRHPQMVYVQLRRAGDAFGDYLQVGDMSQALLYKKQTTRWQSLALGIYLLAFVYALVFFVRMRDPLLGWYTLLMVSVILFFLMYYRLLADIFTLNYIWAGVNITNLYELCWSLFHIKFLNLKWYSKTLYWAIIAVNALIWLDDYATRLGVALTGLYYSVLDKLFAYFGYGATLRIDIVLYLLLISLIYVSLKNFRNSWLYAIAFLSSLVTMIIGRLAWNNFEWLPFIPYNNIWVLGIVIEIVILGYILGERANEHRRHQARTQQQLIGQLQENLRQKNKLLQIRDEIARDLHDEVGATLTAIAISTKLVQRKVGLKRTEISPLLEQIQTDSQDTITAIRDTVWALNPDNDSPEKLLERMRAVGLQLLTAQGITLTFKCEVDVQELPAFSMEQRRNIYLIFKEAVHNIARHAQPTSADVLIAQQAGELHVRISDNGIGFEPVRTSDGNGLKNFQKRASEGGFSVTVCSEPCRGTTVELRIPMH